MRTILFVIDDDATGFGEPGGSAVITFSDYLQYYPKLNEPRVRVINLCDTTRYLSQGYYCSLLAEARHHQVLPTVKVINALRDDNATLVAPAAAIPRGGEPLPDELIVCMGEAHEPRLQKLAGWVYQQYAAPILRLALSQQGGETRVAIRRLALAALSDQHRDFALHQLQRFSSRAWRTRAEQKKYRWELAILTNPAESVPPSNRGAIARFISAAEKLGIRAVEIGPDDFTLLGQFDALFIRETTAIDHHTYRFACEAEKMGLVVIDDPSSILRCCNKVYLHDAFSYKKVPSPRTVILADASSASLDALEQQLGYPIILKIPEGAFSKGVYKVADRAALESQAAALLSESALYIAQQYLYTDFDWRIGVLNGRALFACRYFMAKGHWQIYNHGSKRNFSGGFDAMPTFEVPTHVLRTALKAAAAVGNGLYGIDIKEVDGRAYVLEVNDNPSLEFGVEDFIIGEELYMQIMAEFLRRLEARGL